MQEAVIPRWAHGLMSIFFAAAAAALLTWPDGPDDHLRTYVVFAVSLAMLGSAVLAAVAAVAGRGFLARPRRVRSVSSCRNSAIFFGVLALLMLAVVLTSDFKVRDLGVVFMFCASAVQALGLWTDLSGRTPTTSAPPSTPV